MASGNLSPRQKMINLMYLVFIAMLALNTGKEVLSAFGQMNEKITDSNTRTKDKNVAAYDDLATKAADQEKQFGEAKVKTDSIRVLADDLYNYIEDLKTEMTTDVEDKTNYESMDKSDFLDKLFFASGGVPSEAGKEYVSKINNFKNSVVNILGKRDLAENVKSRFDTDDVTDSEKITKGWLEYHYFGFPLIASLTKMTQIQSDIRSTESDALSALLQKELSDAVSMTNYNGIVALDKNAFYTGEKVTGSVVLGRYDPKLKPSRVEYNGNKNYTNFKDGRVIIDQPSGGVGDKKIKGTIFFTENGEEVPVPFESSYAVIPRPNEAVISADKMNVVYKGLTNPMTISIPGIPTNKVKASAPGLSSNGGSSYSMRPTGAANSEVTISVSGTLPDGKPVSSNKKFRIKDIPPAVGMVRGQFGVVKMPKSSAANITVQAGLPDFLFDLKLQVLSYKLKLDGQLTVTANGSQISAKAKQMIAKAKRGDGITIFDIKAKVTNSGYQIKQVLPVTIQITN